MTGVISLLGRSTCKLKFEGDSPLQEVCYFRSGIISPGETRQTWTNYNAKVYLYLGRPGGFKFKFGHIFLSRETPQTSVHRADSKFLPKVEWQSGLSQVQWGKS